MSDWIDTNRELQTRDGRPVRIYDIVPGQESPIIGAYYAGGEWVPAAWVKGGTYLDDKWTDLVYAPQKAVRYLNIYKTEEGELVEGIGRKSREEADTEAYAAWVKQRVACIRVELKEGRWDD